MTQAYFLIPGLRLPTHAKDHISSETLEQLTDLSKGLCSDTIRQELDTGVYTDSIHYVWAWKVITRRQFAPALAPFRWLMDHGPELLSEVWQLHLAHRNVEGTLVDVEPLLDEATIEALCLCLTPALRQEGFVLQRWDTRLYLTRKTDWGVRVRPWRSIVHSTADACRVEDLEGGHSERATQALEAMRRLEQTLTDADIRLPDGRTIDSLWISEGGHLQRFYPPTLLRSVLTDDPAILAWAQNAGILDHRTGRVSGAEQWPSDAPNGERLAVIDDLYESWLTQDWSAWQQKLPEVIATVKRLSDNARLKGCDSALIVACGSRSTVSLPIKFAPRAFSLLARLTTQKTVPAANWLFEE